MDVISRLKSLAPEAAAAFPCIQVMYLFGSRAADAARPHSDADIAVFAADPAPLYLDLELAVYLEEKLRLPVDVILMRKVSPVVQHEVLRKGVRIWERDPEMRARLEALSCRFYFDAVYVQRRRAQWRSQHGPGAD